MIWSPIKRVGHKRTLDERSGAEEDLEDKEAATDVTGENEGILESGKLEWIRNPEDDEGEGWQNATREDNHTDIVAVGLCWW